MRSTVKRRTKPPRGTHDVPDQHRDQALHTPPPSTTASSSTSATPTSKGKWSVVFFYPADFTFVCPTELGDLADNYAEFQGLGVEIYSRVDRHPLHPQGVARHLRHHRQDRVPDDRRPDRHRSPATSTCCIEGQGLADRGTFVIDPDGIIQVVEITAEGIGRNAAELLRKVKAAQYVAAHPGEVCPAKWEEGDDTLAPSLDLVGKI